MCVYCTVRTESLHIIQFNISSFKLGFSLPMSLHHCSFLILVHTLLIQKQPRGEAWKPSKKQCSFANVEAFDKKVISPSFYSVKNKVWSLICASCILNTYFIRASAFICLGNCYKCPRRRARILATDGICILNKSPW